MRTHAAWRFAQSVADRSVAGVLIGVTIAVMLVVSAVARAGEVRDVGALDGKESLVTLGCSGGLRPPLAGGEERLRVVVETDAGGDPDDEQSLVRFLLYVNEWDVEGIVATRAKARDGENLNTERSGMGIIRRIINAYGEC